jgi:hypothetical protein
MSKIVLNPVQVNRAARAKGHQVVKPLVNKVHGGSKRLVPHGDHRHGSGKSRIEPPLHSTSSSRVFDTANYVNGEVRYSSNIAMTVHQGSQPHEIRGNPNLAFKWARGEASPMLRKRMTRRGQFVFKRVHHPGNKRPRRFLTTPLAQFGRQANFQVKIVSASRGFLP